MKVYTRGGDAGETSLFGGERVSKSSPRVEAYGAVDELNAVLGLALTEIAMDDLRAGLLTIQSSLFDLGGELATPDADARAEKGRPIPRVGDAEVEELEHWIDRLDVDLPPLTSFVLPGGARGAAWMHLARTVCRRAERSVIRLGESQSLSGSGLRYLNRLSDLLFVLARTINHREGSPETPWVGRERA